MEETFVKRLLLCLNLIALLALFGCGDESTTTTTAAVTEATEQISEATTEAATETEETTAATTEETTEATTEATTEEPKIKGVVVIDPGHQGHTDKTPEPIGPGAKKTIGIAGVGTCGVSTKTPEYELTLELSLKLRDELTARGYQVIMTRESNDVKVSCKTRAEIANDANADAFIRIHANGSENKKVKGCMTACISSKNPYQDEIHQDYEKSRLLSEKVLDSLVDSIHTKREGIFERDDLSGNNWAKVPTTLVEVGYMTNPEEDELMATDEYQKKIVDGLANGIDSYIEAVE